MPLSLSHSHLSVSTSPTHTSVGLNVTDPSRPKSQAADPRLRPTPPPNPPSQRSPNPKSCFADPRLRPNASAQTIALVFHRSDPRLHPVLHLNAHPTPIRPLLWFSADQTHPPQTHFSSANQTHADTVLLTEAQLYDWWFFILFVIGDFVWSGLRKKIGDLGFFFLLWTSGGGGCGWW